MLMKQLWRISVNTSLESAINWGVLCQKQVSRAGTSNYIPQILWDVVTCSCPWYLLLGHRSLTDKTTTKNDHKTACIFYGIYFINNNVKYQSGTSIKCRHSACVVTIYGAESGMVVVFFTWVSFSFSKSVTTRWRHDGHSPHKGTNNAEL